MNKTCPHDLAMQMLDYCPLMLARSLDLKKDLRCPKSAPNDKGKKNLARRLKIGYLQNRDLRANYLQNEYDHISFLQVG